MTYATVTTEQRTDDWRAARVGLFTASRAADMLATIKTGEAAARRDLRTQLVVERLTGISAEDTPFLSAAMQRGIDREADARAAYEAARGVVVQCVGLLQHATLLAGASPDGLVDGGGLVEIKCPKAATHFSYLRAPRGTVPREHVAQITHQLWITGATWCDFVSFDDRFPPRLRLLVLRVHRDTLSIPAYELAARLFLSEVDHELAEATAIMDAA